MNPYLAFYCGCLVGTFVGILFIGVLCMAREDRWFTRLPEEMRHGK